MTTSEYSEEIQALRNEGLSFSQIAFKLSQKYQKEITKDSVQKIYKRRFPLKIETVFVTGDIHASPHPDLLAAIKVVNPDGIFFGGDMYDAQEYSRWPLDVNERRKSAELETKTINEWLRTLPKEPWKKFIWGNHDKRILDIIPDNARWMVPEPLKFMIEGVENAEIVKMDVRTKTGEEIGESSYLYYYKGVLFSHQNHSGYEKLLKWYQQWRDVLGINAQALIQFHTHQLRMDFALGGQVFCAECGMGCKPAAEPYKVQYQGKWRPGTPGYIVLKFFGDELVSSAAYRL